MNDERKRWYYRGYTIIPNSGHGWEILFGRARIHSRTKRGARAYIDAALKEQP